MVTTGEIEKYDALTYVDMKEATAVTSSHLNKLDNKINWKSVFDPKGANTKLAEVLASVQR